MLCIMIYELINTNPLYLLKDKMYEHYYEYFKLYIEDCSRKFLMYFKIFPKFVQPSQSN